MTVTLQLQDGTVKEYPAGKSRGGQRRKCGAPDCDHVECTIEGMRSVSRSAKTFATLLPIGTVFTVGMILLVIMESFSPLTIAALLALSVILDIYLVFTFLRTSRALDAQVRELEEFRERKTVNGIPAEQVRGIRPRE